MPNYLHVAGGTLNSAFPWSFRMYSASSSSEATAESTWHGGIAAMFGSSGFASMLATGTALTYTYTSTMSAAWTQTTKTQTNATIAGTGTTSLPYHVATCVTWRSALATRFGRGRWYLPPLDTTSLATGGYTISATAITDIVTAVNLFLTDTVGTLGYLLLHRKGANNGLITPLSTSPIVSGDVGDSYDTQRRRADKRVEARTTLTF